MSLAWTDPAPVRPLNRRTVAALALTAGLAVGWLINETDPATVGSTAIPAGLSCTEDEVVSFVPDGLPPYSLGCVHVDQLAQPVLPGDPEGNR